MLEQVVLPFGTKPAKADVSDTTLLKQPDIDAAIRLSLIESGLQDNQVQPNLGIDKSAFSKAISRGNENSLPAKKLDPFADAVGNDIVLRWWALHRGYKLTKLKSTLEDENAALKRQLDDAHRDLETIKRFVKETR